MVFNGDTNGQDLCTLADNLVKTDAIDFPLPDKALYGNWGRREIWKLILKAYGGWVQEDGNKTTLPEYTAALTLLQLYTFPDNIQTINDVSWMDSSGSWHPLKPITVEDMTARGYAETEFMKTPGNPQFYRPIAGGFKVYPASDTARAAAIRVNGAGDIVPYTAASTSVGTGIDSLFDESVAVYMALQYAKINTMSVAGGVMRGGFKTGLLADWSDACDKITEHYQTKAKQFFPPTVKHRPAFANQFVS